MATSIYIHFRYVSPLTLPRRISTDRHQMLRDLTSLIEVPRNGTGWHETNCTKFSLTEEEIMYIIYEQTRVIGVSMLTVQRFAEH